MLLQEILYFVIMFHKIYTAYHPRIFNLDIDAWYIPAWTHPLKGLGNPSTSCPLLGDGTHANCCTSHAQLAGDSE
ncbi:hypothetical protein MKW92_031942 [Papaver armeniacum]|nr:hypothetical protein MKW92_031942 [Papaver armeniacum]